MTDSYNFFNLRAFSEADQPYACNDWVVFQEKAYKSRKPNNNRHPHDSEYWDEIGLVSGLLDHLLQDNRAIDLSVAFYPECSNGCVAMFGKGGCVIDKVPVFNEDGTQKKDDCGQLVFELMIFTSLVDCNTDAPQEGASKDDPTWDGGYTVCAYLNRPVAGDLEGNIYYPGGKDTIFCGVSCAEVNNPDFRIEGVKLRVNFPEIEVTDTRSIPSGSPVKSSKFVTDHGLKFVIDYDASITPSTATAPSGPYRQVVEASNGKEYLLRSGVGYREHHDGKVEMWGRTIVGVGSEDRAVAAVLPVKLDGPITYGNSHISLTDVGWAAAPGEHLDDLPGAYPNDPSTDKLDQTDMGWGPSTANPTGEFVIWAYQHEQGGSAAIELVSWHLITERGLA